MIEFKTRHKRPNYSLNHTIKRIAQICCGYDYEPDADATSPERKETPCLKKNQTDNWDLGHNEWFLKLLKTDDTCFYWRLSYRYTTDERQVALEGLGKFIELCLGNL